MIDSSVVLFRGSVTGSGAHRVSTVKKRKKVFGIENCAVQEVWPGKKEKRQAKAMVVWASW